MNSQSTKTGFTVVSWNVNGLRTLNMKEVLKEKLNMKCSILALQETKLSRSQLEESQAQIDDYTSYFAFCKNRSGYSGVATYCSGQMTPLKAEEGISGVMFDEEYRYSTDAVGGYPVVGQEMYSDAKYGDCDGRSVITQHTVYEPDGIQRALNVINVYCPRLRDDPADAINNKQFKLTFHNLLAERAQTMINNGQFVLIMGDLNVSHRFHDQSEIDDPTQFRKTDFREWLDELLADEEIGLADTFRSKHPNRAGAFTCWNTRLNSRENNHGARIDFILADHQLMRYLDSADVHQDVMGSDHCPISATFHTLTPKSSNMVPMFATKFYPEFAGKQQKLTDMLKRQESSQCSPIAMNSMTTGLKNNSMDTRKRAAQSSPVITKTAKQTSLTSFLLKKPKTESTDEDSSEVKSIIKASPTETVTTSSSQDFYKEINSGAAAVWKHLLKTPDTPICTGHHQKCVLRTVKKQGVHKGRQFWGCPRGSGNPKDPNASCNFFQWANAKT